MNNTNSKIDKESTFPLIYAAYVYRGDSAANFYYKIILSKLLDTKKDT